MKTGWWYDNSFFEYGKSDELVLARLTVRDDGTAQILRRGRSLNSSTKQRHHLALDEEYTLLETSSRTDGTGPASGPRIKPPTAPRSRNCLPDGIRLTPNRAGIPPTLTDCGNKPAAASNKQVEINPVGERRSSASK